MPTLALAPLVDLTMAEHLARLNWAANLRALAASQPDVATILSTVDQEMDWVFARDGSLTAMQSNGQWWAGCSVPLLAGRALLKPLEAEGHGNCLLAPPHAGMIRAARERIGPSAVLFVVQPDVNIARLLMSCEDFSEQIATHRLWLICGEDWSARFTRLFNDRPGLATPSRFIRTKLLVDDLATPMIAEAQTVFSNMLGERTAQLAAMKSEPITVTDRRQVLLIGGTQFRLWNDGLKTLQSQLESPEQIGALTIHHFDPDDALCTSPAALVQASRNCGSVLSADLYRADSNDLLPMEMPWITWMTRPAAPPFTTAGPHDALVLADASWKAIVKNAGWPEDRVRIAGWPLSACAAVDESSAAPSAPTLGLICDTKLIEIPKSVKEFSSHRLLWDLIEEELRADPLVVEDTNAYLDDRAGQLHVGGDLLNRSMFIDGLILPAYQQGLARLLIAAGLPIKIWGTGWGDLPEFAEQFSGIITSEDDFQNTLNRSSGLVYCWPSKAAHPIDATGKLLVYRAGRDQSQLIRNAKRVLTAAGRKPAEKADAEQGLIDVVLELLTHG